MRGCVRVVPRARRLLLWGRYKALTRHSNSGVVAPTHMSLVHLSI